jgi:hypothetical protein
MMSLIARVLRRALVALIDPPIAELRRRAVNEAMCNLLAGPRRSAATLAAVGFVLGAALRDRETTESRAHDVDRQRGAN